MRLPNIMDTEVPKQSKSSFDKEGKEKQVRRLWILKEEKALLSCMLEQFSDKWRADNGFKSGFFTCVEKQLQKVLPGTTLKAQPNIESKVKNWKEKYGLLADMMRLSGFSWNHVNKSIEVDSESVWEEYAKHHSKAKGMNGKAFPMFESWQILFGKDRATGELAEDAADLDGETDPLENTNIDDIFNDSYSPVFANGDPVLGSDAFVAYHHIPQPPMSPLQQAMPCRKGQRRSQRWWQKKRPFMKHWGLS